MDDDDAALLAAVVEGSDPAFNRLVDRHQQAVRTFIRGIVSGPEDADDIAQEAFLSAWRNARKFNGGSVRSWLFSIAWRKALDSRRRWSRGRRRDELYHQGEQLAPEPRAGAEEVLTLADALETLTVDQKAAIILCLGLGLSNTEAALALGAPLGTVKSHVARGRERLREVFGDES